MYNLIAYVSETFYGTAIGDYRNCKFVDKDIFIEQSELESMRLLIENILFTVGVCLQP